MATLRHFQFLFWSLTSMWAGLRADPINDESLSPEEPFPWSHPRLPTSVQPDHYFIHIHPNLRSKTFRGYVHILLTALNQTDLILLNSKHLAVSNASLKQLTMPSYLIKDLSSGVNSPQMEVLDKPNQQELPRDQQGLDQAIISEDVKELLLPLQPISEEYAQSSNSALPPPCHLSVRILDSNFSEQLAVIPNTPLRAGYRYLLTLSFSGVFSTRMSGLYAASYKTPNGKARPIAVTHFEPSSARRVFPCFDEPSMKALFTLVIVRDCRHISLSNMPKVSSHLRADGLEEDQYLTSVKMSSYLVAFVICDFAANSAETKSGVKVSVFTANHLINQTNYALKAAVKILDFYEEYFQIPYPLPKLDLVAVPNFEAVAMESWGLLMFRETALLVDGDSTDLRWKFRSSLVTAHELTHQWFGNLVTPCWWQDLWLKEGMASYLEYFPLLQLQPDWHVEDQQLLLSFFKALEQDSFVTSHPMSRPTNQPAEIREMFDVISYAKGASVIRMLHAHLSHPVFERGLQLYLGRHSYSSARPGDLWSALTEVSIQSGDCVDVNALMDPWIKLAGYPLVSLTVQGTKLLLHQEPFTTIPNNDTDKVWQIPLSFFTSDSLSVTTHLMKSKEEVLDLPRSVQWIKANVKSSGFYRVRYDPALLNGLLCLLKKNHSSLSAADKAGFIDDVFHLARQGALKYSKALTLSLYLRKEREYLPISISCKHISQMILRLQFGKQDCAVHLLKAHLWRVLGRQARAEKWEEEGSLPGQGRRALLLDLGVKSSVVMERMATRHFYFWMATNGRQTLPQSLLGLVWRVGVWRGGHEEWVFLLRQHQRSQSSAERAALLLALCRTTCYKKKKWLLKAAYRGHVFRTQDLTTVVDQLASRPDSNDLVWTFLKENWDKLLLKFPLGSSYLSGMVNSVTSHFHCSRKYDEVYDFFVNQRNLGHMQFVRHALEMIEINTLWLKTNTKAIEFWLRRTYPLAYKTYPLCKKDVTYHLRWGATIHLRI